MITQLTVIERAGELNVHLGDAAHVRPLFQAPIPFVTGFSPDDRSSLDWLLDEYAADSHQHARAQAIEARLTVLGRHFYDSVFARDGQSAQAIREALIDSNRVEIRFVSDSPAFHAMPWELLRSLDDGQPLINSTYSLSRAITEATTTPIEQISCDPLRILIVISRERKQGEISFTLTSRPLLQLLDRVDGHVEVEVLRPPIINNLLSQLVKAREAGRPYHLVHFDTHGSFGAMLPNGVPQSYLHLENKRGGVDIVPSAHVGAALAAGGIATVVLNACHSGRVSPTATLNATLTASFLKAGVLSVVAMRHAVSAETACEFAAAYYEPIIRGVPDGHAVNLARRHLMLQASGVERSDWIIPVHYCARTVAFTVPPRRRPQRTRDSADIDTPAAKSQPSILSDALIQRCEHAFYHSKTVLLTGRRSDRLKEQALNYAHWRTKTSGGERLDISIVNAAGLADFAKRTHDSTLVLLDLYDVFPRLLLTSPSEPQASSDLNALLASVEQTVRDSAVSVLAILPGDCAPELPWRVVEAEPMQWRDLSHALPLDMTRVGYEQIDQILRGSPMAWAAVLQSAGSSEALLESFQKTFSNPGLDLPLARAISSASDIDLDEEALAPLRWLVYPFWLGSTASAQIGNVLSRTELLPEITALQRPDWEHAFQLGARLGVLRQVFADIYEIDPPFAFHLRRRLMADAEDAESIGARIFEAVRIAWISFGSFLLNEFAGPGVRYARTSVQALLPTYRVLLRTVLGRRDYEALKILTLVLFQAGELFEDEELMEALGASDDAFMAEPELAAAPTLQGLDFQISSVLTSGIYHSHRGSLDRAFQLLTWLRTYLEHTEHELMRNHYHSPVLHELGMLAAKRHQIAAARELLGMSLQMDRARADTRNVAKSYLALAKLAYRVGDVPEANARCLDAVRLCRELDDKVGEYECMDFSIVVGMEADPTRVEQDLTRARTLAELLGRDDRVIDHLQSLSLLRMQKGEMKQAIAYQREAVNVARARANESLDSASSVFLNMGVILLAAEQCDEAREWLTAALQGSRDCGDVMGYVMALQEMGILCSKEGLWDESEKHLAAAFSIATDRGYNRLAVGAAGQLCRGACERRLFDYAIEWLALAVRHIDGDNDPMAERLRANATEIKQVVGSAFFTGMWAECSGRPIPDWLFAEDNAPSLIHQPPE